VQIVDPASVSPQSARHAIETVHAKTYVSQVLDEGVSNDWVGAKLELGATASTMFAGTMALVNEMSADRIRVGFNPQGAKHHAAFDHSTGFCVFNDMAWAALELKSQGFRPLYLDWDIHAGDGVQDLLEQTDIPTLSIHNGSIYPGNATTRDVTKRGERHTWHNPDKHYYNWCVAQGDGDDAFGWAISGAMEVIAQYQPDVILLAAGADGHEGADNLGGTNTYTYAGYQVAALKVAQAALDVADCKVLIGGAGGYQPLDHTPRIWANVVETIYSALC